MHIEYNKLSTHIDLAAIRHNWQLLNQRGGNAMAVVKSDAYGHGLVEVSRALAEEGARTFGVGTVEEAVNLRLSGAVSPEHRVIALLGPVDDWEYPALAEHQIIPFIGNFEQLARMAETAPSDTRLPLALKFDTGMSRLGFAEQELDRLLAALAQHPSLLPVMASSHLATGDDPNQADYAREQGDTLARILARLTKAGHQLETSLANSGAILGHPGLHHATQRAGISLYGTNPFTGTPWEELGAGLKPAMAVSAPVLDVHTLSKGATLSYGRSFEAKRDMTVAIIGAGYADGYARHLTDRAAMCLHGVRVSTVGRVCMQMTAVDLTPLDESGGKRAQVGDRAWLLGGHGPGTVSADELAAWWGTITYEVFCLLGMNRKSFDPPTRG